MIYIRSKIYNLKLNATSPAENYQNEKRTQINNMKWDIGGSVFWGEIKIFTVTYILIKDSFTLLLDSIVAKIEVIQSYDLELYLIVHLPRFFIKNCKFFML